MYQVFPSLAPPPCLVDIRVWRKSLNLCKQNVITQLIHTEFLIRGDIGLEEKTSKFRIYDQGFFFNICEFAFL